MKQTVTLIVFAFLFFMLFIVLSSPLETIFDTVEDAADENIERTNPLTSIFSFLRNVFGIIIVLAMIGIVIAYFVQSHKNEYEEYQYYERYR